MNKYLPRDLVLLIYEFVIDKKSNVKKINKDIKKCIRLESVSHINSHSNFRGDFVIRNGGGYSPYILKNWQYIDNAWQRIPHIIEKYNPTTMRLNRYFDNIYYLNQLKKQHLIEQEDEILELSEKAKYYYKELKKKVNIYQEEYIISCPQDILNIE